ncbi:MAG: PfkB family carbohydrate kinase [Bacteroidota bacterium]
MSTVIVGTVAFDKIETPFGKTDKILGGAATFISLTAAPFADDVHIISVEGGDFPDAYIKLLTERGIHTDGLQVKPEGKSFYWSGRYHTDMNTRDTLVTELNVLADFDPILPASCLEPEFVVLGNLTPSVQMRVLDQLKKRPKLIVMDTMNYWMDSAWDDLMKVIARVDVLMVNDSEARQLTGEYSLVKAAQKILTMGPKFLVIKKGEHGALLFHGDSVFFAPALPLEEVFDPTGAGDTFAGGFIGHLASTGDISFGNMKNAIIYGSAMASFTVEKFGTEGLLNLTKENIYERLKLFVDLVQFDISLVNS